MTSRCLNDRTWLDTSSGTCAIDRLSVTAEGARYSVACAAKNLRAKGAVELRFDGMEHMTGKGSLEMTMNGISSNTQYAGDYRWKADICESGDVNLKKKSAP